MPCSFDHIVCWLCHISKILKSYHHSSFQTKTSKNICHQSSPTCTGQSLPRALYLLNIIVVLLFCFYCSPLVSSGFIGNCYQLYSETFAQYHFCVRFDLDSKLPVIGQVGSLVTLCPLLKDSWFHLELDSCESFA